MTQVLEGYWGDSDLSQRLMAARMARHWERRDQLLGKEDAAVAALGELTVAGRRHSLAAVPHVALLQEAQRLQERYPQARSAIMPTRLGNVLRVFESQAGAQYGLPALRVAPHLALVAPARDLAYMEDQRQEMDLAIRLCWLSGLASLLTVAFLWRAGWWLLLAAIPYCAMYLFYRGAIIVAIEYGTAVATALDLNRFALYERMHLESPDDSTSERGRNSALVRLLSRKHEHVKYAHPVTASSGDAEAAAPEPGPSELPNTSVGSDDG
jgi:hypothetical protein